MRKLSRQPPTNGKKVNERFLGEFWNNTARLYDGLYTDPWSTAENDSVRKIIASVAPKLGTEILDLGCGTGLGFVLCQASIPGMRYTGVDISEAMLAICRTEYPGVTLIQTPMHDLSAVRSGSVDLVISIFASFSYTVDVPSTISEIQRVLRPGGKVVISALAKFSLRRLVRFKIGGLEAYATRNCNLASRVKVNVFSGSKLRSIFSEAGFNTIEIVGLNPFTGIEFLMKPVLWEINNWLARHSPNLSHEIILTGVRPPEVDTANGVVN